MTFEQVVLLLFLGGAIYITFQISGPFLTAKSNDRHAPIRHFFFDLKGR